MRTRVSRLVLAALLFVCMGLSPGFSQLPSLPSLPSLPIPGIDRLTRAERAITTSLSDAVTEVPFLDDFNPRDAAPVRRLQRGPHNGFILDRPGLFEAEVRSYCMGAGTYVPARGDGHVYARLAGPRAPVIRKVLQNSVAHPEIPQRTVQTLIWAILAYTRISETPAEVQAAAARLLTPGDINELNGGALGVVPPEVLRDILSRLPAPVRQAMEAEAQLRRLLTQGRATFEELERAAVRFGVAPRGEGSREVPRGRWSYHPVGYFIRYFPDGYTRTRLQFYVPDPTAIERDPNGRIASITDQLGNRIEAAYDDRAEPGSVPGAQDVRAHALAAIRLTALRPLGSTFVELRRAEWRGGWTFVGIPAPAGGPAPLAARFPGASDRYQRSLGVGREAASVVREAGKLQGRRDAPAIAPAAQRDLADLAHFAMAIRSTAGEAREVRPEWAHDHLLLAQKAWAHALARAAGAPDHGASVGIPATAVASAGLATVLLSEKWSPCDDPPQDPKGKSEMDPTDGIAVPGNTNGQSIKSSATEASPGPSHPDCGRVAAEKSDAEKMRKVYEDNPPQKNESGDAYLDRIGKIVGLDKPGGAIPAAEINLDTCEISGNKAYFQSRPDVVRRAACAHERVHQIACFITRALLLFDGFRVWLGDPANLRQNELDAYAAEIKMLDDWMKANCR